MISNNPYEALGIPKGASQEEIKKAYREKAKIHHPDKGGNEEDFKKIQNAYETLSDSNKKRQYDSGSEFSNNGNRRPSNDRGFGFGDFHFHEDIFGGGAGINFDEIFSQFFGNNKSSKKRQEESICRSSYLFLLEEIFNSSSKRISYTKNAFCKRCSGNGSKNGTHTSNCSNCGGTGMSNERRGPMMIRTTCGRCGGTGRIITTSCDACNGAGMKIETATIDVDMPISVHNGMTLRVQGAGNDPKGEGVPGDLYIIIKETPHSFFRRIENDLHCKKEISYIDAVLGCDINIEGIDERVLSIKIPPGTQPGNKFELRGEGMKIQHGARGNLFTEINVSIPSTISEKEKEALEKLRDSQKK